MEYLNEIEDWVENFKKTICVKEIYTNNEIKNITDLYINLRSRYTKDLIDKITKSTLISDDSIINHFKSEEIAEKEINDLFNFFIEKNQLLNSSEFKESLSDSLFDVNKIKDFKSKKIKETGILDFVEFKKYFKHDVAFCDIKEAIGWCLAYIESGDYDLNKIIIYNENNEIDKQKTFVSIIEDINKKSLTNVPPFRLEGDKFSFVAAGSSEIDVKLWNESEQRFIGMSATRDRTNIIEGNQFIRHNMNVFAWSAIFETYKKRAVLPSEFKLSTNDIRKIMHDYGWQGKLKDKNILKIKGLDSDVINSIENSHLEFARHLSFVREYIKNKDGISFHENGLKITEEEIDKITKTFKDNSKFYFFGEILGKAEVPEINAGLIKRSYLSNFKNIMSFELDQNASKKFMDSIEVRFNNVDKDSNIEQFAEFTVFSFLTNEKEDFIKIAKIFSEGSAYKEERGMLYKNVSLFFEDIINKENISESINFHFSTLNDSFKIKLRENIENGSIFETIKINYKSIGKAQSEVNQYSENMFSLVSALENNLKYNDEKKNNDLMLEYLKNQGIEINIDDFNKFKVNKTPDKVDFNIKKLTN